MKKRVDRPAVAKTFVRLLFISACISASSISFAQVSVHRNPQDTAVLLQYLGSRDNFSRMSLRIKNPESNMYRITITDVYKGFGEFKNVLFEEYNKTPGYATTFVIPADIKGVEIVVENRKTKVSSTFLANHRYVSDHDVVITRVNTR